MRRGVRTVHTRHTRLHATNYATKCNGLTFDCVVTPSDSFFVACSGELEAEIRTLAHIWLSAGICIS